MKRIVKLACIVPVLGAFVGSAIGEVPESLPAAATVFVQDNCVHCHDAETKEGGLDLEALSFDLSDTSIFGRWVEIHDRVRDGEMPPPDDTELTPVEQQELLESIAPPMVAADRERIARHGRAKLRRLNRLEYENTLRAVLDAPWLQVADMLPEDGVAHLFNKVGDRLDVSHVQITRYLAAADHAIRAAIHAAAHQTTTNKYYAREEPVMQHYLRYRFGQTAATRAVIPLIGTTPQPDVVRGILPVTVGDSDPGLREQEAFGVVCGTYTATLKYDFTRMRVPTDGMYRLRMKSYTFLAGPNGRSGGDDHGLTGGTAAWWRPSRTEAFPGTRSEPITLYALADSGDSRWLTTFDSFPEPAVIEREVALKTGEAIRPDAGRLVRTRPGWSGNPNATQAGVPGFAMNWLEVTGPLHEEWPPASYEAVFGDLPFEVAEDGSVRAVSEHPDDDARPLLLDVLKKAYRRPLRDETEVEPFFAVYREAIALGEQFTDAMIAAFSAILSSPDFLYFESPAGPLDRSALASRLSYFLWNGPPDAKLNVGLTCNSVKTESQDRAAGVAAYNEPLRVHTDRLLDDPRSGHFIDSFLDYWLDLRDINANAPDAELYPDYYIDDLLTESSIRETRMFFRKLIENDLPVRNLVDSDFAFVNERLADHYGLPTLEGVEPRRVALPEKSPRGGLLTQASILRVTANGTTTSPVVRGAWVMERIMGLEIPPPPSAVAAIEPDIRGASTIREQLDKHRTIASCAACHATFDPPGFALESFDIAGGWRETYRATGDEGEPAEGTGKNGHKFTFRYAQPVDCSGELADGREFSGIRELKQLLASDERQLARNLVHRLVVYATGAPVSFSDRAEVEAILDRGQQSGYGVRSLIHAVVQSEIFRAK